jgi:hypothetical protein
VADPQPARRMIGTDVDPHKHHRASRRGGRPTQEAVMGKAIPAQHPAVVLRSHYRQLRAMLAIAMIAVVGLTVAVVILATNDDGAALSPIAAPAPQVTAAGPTGSTRYDGGPEEGTRGAVAGPPVGTRYDGGPDEGTRGAVAAPPVGTRYDGGPDEGTRGIVAAPPLGTRYDGGPEEGSRGLAR